MPPKFPTTTTPSSTTAAAASRPRAQTFLPSESIKSPTSQVKKLPATSTTTTTKLADQLESSSPAASQRINNSFAGTKNTSFTGTKPTGSGSVDSTSTTQRDSPVPLSSAATVEKTVGNVTSPAKAASTVKPPVGPPAAVVASGSSKTTTGSPAIAFPPTTEIATVPSQQEVILPPALTPAEEQQQPAAVVISPHHGPTAATVASISTLIAGMMEKKGNSTDETQEAARWMRSELVLLVEQANSLKERRLQLESRRAELLDAVTDHVVHLLPSHLLGGGGGGGSGASQSTPQPSSFLASHDNHYSSVLLQNTAISQAVSGRINPWSMQHKISTSASSPFPHHQQHAFSNNNNNNATHTATAPYYHSSRDETTNILNAALDAQRSLFRCMLSQRFLEHGGAAAGSDHQPHQLHQQDTPPLPGFSSTAGATASSTSSPSPSRRMVPIAQEIADTQTETRKRNIELQVLSQREALLQQQSQSLLQEMRAELEKRDGLLKRRSELKKADSLAASAAANLASLSTSSLGSTASALLAEYSLQELRDRKAALHLEWQRLRAASAAKQQPYRESLSSIATTSSGALNHRNPASTLSANTSFASNSSLPNATYESQSFRRSMDPTILLLPYAAVADSISAAHPYPQPSSYRSMTTGSSLQQQQQQPHWVLPEQYLVRTL